MRRNSATPKTKLKALIEKVEIAHVSGVLDALSIARLERLAKRIKNKRKRNKKRGIRREEKLRRQSGARSVNDPQLLEGQR